ncbi:MAG: phage tail protein [Thiohalospira sp.]
MSLMSLAQEGSRVVQVASAVREQIANRARPMMMLGPFLFSAGSAAPQQTDHRHRYSWASQERLGKRPLLQYTGPGEERLDLDGTIYPQWKGGLYQMSLLRALAETGEPQLLVDGVGMVWGMWVVHQVEETGAVLDGKGAPRRIEFRVSLEFAED